MAGMNGLPIQSNPVSTPRTQSVEDYGIFNMISGLGDFITKGADTFLPYVDKYYDYKTRRTNRVVADDSMMNSDFTGGFNNPNNQTLLTIAGLAAAAVAIVIIAR